VFHYDSQRYTHMDAEDLRRQVAELPGNGRSVVGG
jgi:hypothetical protein